MFFCSGADVNLPDYRGLTPLKLARRYGQEDIEEMLMTRGAVLEATKDDEDEKGFAERTSELWQ